MLWILGGGGSPWGKQRVLRWELARGPRACLDTCPMSDSQSLQLSWRLALGPLEQELNTYARPDSQSLQLPWRLALKPLAQELFLRWYNEGIQL